MSKISIKFCIHPSQSLVLHVNLNYRLAAGRVDISFKKPDLFLVSWQKSKQKYGLVKNPDQPTNKTTTLYQFLYECPVFHWKKMEECNTLDYPCTLDSKLSVCDLKSVQEGMDCVCSKLQNLLSLSK